ncbi:MAG: 3-deoxy-D-manno-octulosonic acid transferase [Paucimonas sp.]|nr:3-deoxy-D-manno-octulosonic acid transferase [Paucimonas sp.]
MPLVLLRLWRRGRKEPGYLEHWNERFAWYGENDITAKEVLWVHAVSVGETRAAEPLIDALLEKYPQRTILLTHMTPTGRATGQSLFAKHGARLRQGYLPYDTGWMMRRFIRRFAPKICVLMETEVWPNLVAECAAAGVPVALVNARLSQRSLRKGLRFGALIKPAIAAIRCIGAQTDGDAERLRILGAQKVQVTGSVKFDIAPPADMVDRGLAMRSGFGDRPVLLCASTREGEESLLLDALGMLKVADTLIIIVPRHPQRFDEVAQMLEVRGISYLRRTRISGNVPADVRVVLGDTMGEMFAYYAACDVAFIGGSLLPLGGQNLIEACMLGKPVLIGPHTFNFAVVSEAAVEAGGALRVDNAADMMKQATLLLQNLEKRAQMERSAHGFSLQHRGATSRTAALLEELVS